MSPPHQVLRLRGGGKVHGSLARAGKVKGQTPKVEKQEKRKTPRGRAKKRILYSRRFLNVATGVGGKRLGVRSRSGGGGVGSWWCVCWAAEPMRSRALQTDPCFFFVHPHKNTA